MTWKNSSNVRVVLNMDGKWTVSLDVFLMIHLLQSLFSSLIFLFACSMPIAPGAFVRASYITFPWLWEEELTVSEWHGSLGCKCQRGALCFLKTTLSNHLRASRAAQRLQSLFIEMKLVFIGIVFSYCGQTADRNGQCRKPACWEVFLGRVMPGNVDKTCQKAVRRDLKNLFLRLLSWIVILSRREICAAEMMCQFSRCYE